MTLRTLLFSLLLFGVGVVTMSAQSQPPQKGYVPDEATAIRIAEAVFIPIYGEQHVHSERPFRARLDGEYWVVSGSLPKPRSKDELIVGGTMTAEINRQTAMIRAVYHMK